MDMGFNFSASLPFSVGTIQFNNRNEYRRIQIAISILKADFKRYNSFDATSAVERFSFQDNFYSNDVRINVVAQLADQFQ